MKKKKFNKDSFIPHFKHAATEYLPNFAIQNNQTI